MAYTMHGYRLILVFDKHLFRIA